MASKDKFIRFTIDPKNPSKEFINQWKRFSMEQKKIFKTISSEGVRHMKTLVPVKTGRLRNSVEAKYKETKSGDIDFRSNIQIGSFGVPYARYQNDGTQRSPGRYVPILKKRLKQGRPNIGFHPGFKGHHYIEKTKEYIDEHIDNIIRGGIEDAKRKSRRK